MLQGMLQKVYFIHYNSVYNDNSSQLNAEENAFTTEVLASENQKTRLLAELL